MGLGLAASPKNRSFAPLWGMRFAYPHLTFSRLPYVPSSLQANPRGDSHHRPLNTALKLNIDEAYIIIFSVTHFF